MSGPLFWLAWIPGLAAGWIARSALQAWRDERRPRRQVDELARRRRSQFHLVHGTDTGGAA